MFIEEIMYLSAIFAEKTCTSKQAFVCKNHGHISKYICSVETSIFVTLLCTHKTLEVPSRSVCLLI